jgi:hypothetical protein
MYRVLNSGGALFEEAPYFLMLLGVATAVLTPFFTGAGAYILRISYWCRFFCFSLSSSTYFSAFSSTYFSYG